MEHLHHFLQIPETTEWEEEERWWEPEGGQEWAGVFWTSLLHSRSLLCPRAHSTAQDLREIKPVSVLRWCGQGGHEHLPTSRGGVDILKDVSPGWLIKFPWIASYLGVEVYGQHKLDSVDYFKREGIKLGEVSWLWVLDLRRETNIIYSINLSNI